MKVDKAVIKQRKALYGDNFECIAKTWSGFFIESDVVLDGYQVALMMSDMKQCRIDAIDEKMKKFPMPAEALQLIKAKEDSITDRENYLWIANNYEEYKGL